MHTLKLLVKIAGWFLVASAAICLLISLIAFFHTRSFVQSAIRARGTVIKLVEQDSSDSGKVYHPVCTFHDAQGVEHEILSSVGSFPPAYKVGDTVAVLYRANQPEEAELDAFFDLWGVAAIAGGIGAINMILGLVLLLIPIIIWKFKHEPPVIKTG